MKRAIALLMLGLGLVAHAEPQLSPQNIVVNPVPTELQVQVGVDRDPAGRANPVYQIGEKIVVNVSVNQDAYVYLFGVYPNGEISPILPNPYDRDNFLRAGETRRFPPVGARYEFTIDGPEGQHRVLALASKRPLNVGSIIDSSLRPLVRGADALGRAIAIVVDPIPDQEWVTDVTFFTVGRSQPQPQPVTGTLNVTSNPQGAQVFVDGRLVGNTPISVSVQPGRHDIELRLAGYDTYRTSVNVGLGQVISINATLERPRPATGTLVVNSSPQGAQVFIDGRLVGNTPISVSLNPGRADVELRLDGYDVFRTSVVINPGQTTSVNAGLNAQRRTGVLNVTSNPSGADVYINNQRVGRTPYSVQLNEGTYDLRVSLPGHADYRTTVRVDRNQETRINAQLAPLRAQLTVSSNVEARVFVDGREVGTVGSGGSVRFEVDPGRHQVVLIAPGYRAFVTEVNLRSGENETIRANLSRLNF
ncbi:PEGA domain protein [Calidithermus terrae]|uniref:PEGA domain protein n=1 Tax=Calidithermus terrae TaxID=1408545 RepID=A0A399EJY6_9DEIN|nr:PEGA domain-containing protein [Calidithermus terrae]RIH84248.1 PEGA domain protein [Calidithermus terrae]